MWRRSSLPLGRGRMREDDYRGSRRGMWRWFKESCAVEAWSREDRGVWEEVVRGYGGWFTFCKKWASVSIVFVSLPRIEERCIFIRS